MRYCPECGAKNHDDATLCENCGRPLSIEDAREWLNKGLILLDVGKFQEAIEYFDKALDIDPKCAEAWVGKGAVLNLNFRKPQEAIECFDKALDLKPADAVAWVNKGSALVSLGRFHDAIKCFEKFIEFAPPSDTSQVEQAKEIIYELKRII